MSEQPDDDVQRVIINYRSPAAMAAEIVRLRADLARVKQERDRYRLDIEEMIEDVRRGRKIVLDGLTRKPQARD